MSRGHTRDCSRPCRALGACSFSTLTLGAHLRLPLPGCDRRAQRLRKPCAERRHTAGLFHSSALLVEAATAADPTADPETGEGPLTTLQPTLRLGRGL